MKHIKKFENFNQTIPATNVGNLITYYKCGECSELFKKFNDKILGCLSCGSRNLVILDINVFYGELESQLGSEYRDKIQNIKSQEMNTIVNLSQLKTGETDQEIALGKRLLSQTGPRGYSTRD